MHLYPIMRDYDTNTDKKIERFWQHAYKKADEERLNTKNIVLPLARIKRLMKVEEGVRMVASEVPVIFSLVAEKFIEELTLRSWANTEENKRRILQTNDISVAVKTSEVFDFLVYIVPRNEVTSVFERMMGQNDVLHKRPYNTPIVLGKLPTNMNDDNRYDTMHIDEYGTKMHLANKYNIPDTSNDALSISNLNTQDQYRSI